MLPQTHQVFNIFIHSGPTVRWLYVSGNYPYTNVKKTVFPKNVLIQHC